MQHEHTAQMVLRTAAALLLGVVLLAASGCGWGTLPDTELPDLEGWWWAPGLVIAPEETIDAVLTVEGDRYEYLLFSGELLDGSNRGTFVLTGETINVTVEQEWDVALGQWVSAPGPIVIPYEVAGNTIGMSVPDENGGTFEVTLAKANWPAVDVSLVGTWYEIEGFMDVTLGGDGAYTAVIPEVSSQDGTWAVVGTGEAARMLVRVETENGLPVDYYELHPYLYDNVEFETLTIYLPDGSEIWLEKWEFATPQ